MVRSDVSSIPVCLFPCRKFIPSAHVSSDRSGAPVYKLCCCRLPVWHMESGSDHHISNNNNNHDIRSTQQRSNPHVCAHVLCADRRVWALPRGICNRSFLGPELFLQSRAIFLLVCIATRQTRRAGLGGCIPLARVRESNVVVLLFGISSCGMPSSSLGICS